VPPARRADGVPASIELLTLFSPVSTVSPNARIKVRPLPVTNSSKISASRAGFRFRKLAYRHAASAENPFLLGQRRQLVGLVFLTIGSISISSLPSIASSRR
jgi:hypothetical protein